MAATGFAVLQIADSPTNRFRRINTHYVEWAPSSADRINLATRWLGKEKLDVSAGICIYGIGHGGYSALMATLEARDVYACVAATNAPVDLNALDEHELHYRLRRNPDPSLSPVNHAAAFDRPLMLVHGEKNLRVPVIQARQFRDDVQAAGGEISYREYKDADHLIEDFDSGRELTEILLAFFNQYLR
jgi:dipeptidyl aminopeptidase/acylaminoacyl peptidase